MEIKQKLPIKKVGNRFEILASWALPYIFGSSSVVGNLNLYGVKKIGTKYVVPRSIIVERLEILKKRSVDLQTKIEIIKNILEA